MYLLVESMITFDFFEEVDISTSSSLESISINKKKRIVSLD